MRAAVFKGAGATPLVVEQVPDPTPLAGEVVIKVHRCGICGTDLHSTSGHGMDWPLQGLTVIHRFGRIAPGENIVLVVTASAHRQAAFEAAEFLMDYLKTSAPFWKREESAEGTSWIEARDHDDAAAARWTKS